MSKEGERIATLEANYKNVMDKVEEILSRFDILEDKIDSALEKKADKSSQWAEPFLKWLGVLVGTGIISYFGYLIVKLIEL